MTYPAIKKTLVMLSGEQIGFCKSASRLIALYRRIDYYEAEERNKGKLSGYLTALVHMGIITDYEMNMLFDYYTTRDRSSDD